MTLDARLHSLDTRAIDLDGAQRASRADRGATTTAPTDDETTVLRLAGMRAGRAPEALDADATVLRIARHARRAS